MAIAGYQNLLSVATGDSATYVAINGIKSFSISDSRDLLDITDFADSNVHARLAALRDVTVEASGDYELTDTTGWGKLRAAYDAGDDIIVQILTSAVATTAGFAFRMKAASIDISAAADGKAEVSVNLMINSSAATAIMVI